MLRKYSILLGLSISILLLLIATSYYPGGSQQDSTAIGFNWKNNYLCNLFNPKAVNGANNAARPWAIIGMLLLCASFAWFFIRFSKKIPSKKAANIVQYFGAGGMLAAFLVVTPYHDTMVTLASTLGLVSMFYITVFILKSRLLFLKVFSIICLLALYCTNYVYYTSHYLAFLPIMQKIVLVLTLTWMLALEHFTKREDFQHIQLGKKKKNQPPIA